MRVAPIASVGEGAGVDVGIIVVAANVGAIDVAIGVLVGADATGVAVACGAAVGGGEVGGGKKSEQARRARVKEMSEVERGRFIIKPHYIL